MRYHSESLSVHEADSEAHNQLKGIHEGGNINRLAIAVSQAHQQLDGALKEG
jgi:hypothetical protein